MFPACAAMNTGDAPSSFCTFGFTLASSRICRAGTLFLKAAAYTGAAPSLMPSSFRCGNSPSRRSNSLTSPDKAAPYMAPAANRRLAALFRFSYASQVFGGSSSHSSSGVPAMRCSIRSLSSFRDAFARLTSTVEPLPETESGNAPPLSSSSTTSFILAAPKSSRSVGLAGTGFPPNVPEPSGSHAATSMRCSGSFSRSWVTLVLTKFSSTHQTRSRVVTF
mmetsp:Transcript_161983/g.295774  ORF Transcript_161983/g.295774 Transcript_161983/m.295774 type:complete len:221 (+) Transcript_161983:143-805(+)